MSALWAMREQSVSDGMTIVAVATSLSTPGIGQRALIRLSGPAIASGLEGVVAPIPTHRQAIAARLTLGRKEGAELTVPVLLMRGVAPQTFTGEDTFEISLPAHSYLIERVLRSLMSLPGVRLANPGEFAARAYLAGKMSLDQAQHVAALISASRDEDLLAANLVRSGEPGQRAMLWAQDIAEILALIEAGIDFADQDDVVAISVNQRESRLRDLLERMAKETHVHIGADAARSAGHRVVLWGPPNAGKSTLFNALLGKVRAVASPIAGTTRDALEEEWEPALGAHAMLVDVAGVAEVDPRQERTHLDSAARAAARRALHGVDVVLWCDPTGEFAPSGRPTVDDEVRVIRVRTMADLPRQFQSPREDIAVCALDGWQVNGVAQAVHHAITAQVDAGSDSRSAVQLRLVPRHRAAVENTIRRLHEALDAAHSDEVCATALRLALNALGEMTGHISADEVLGRVFARFCIGK